MTTEDWIAYCLSKPGAYIDHPFGAESTILKVEKRIFAQFFLLHGQEMCTLNCDAASGQFYRQAFPNIVVRGWHCPPVQQPYFNTFPLNGALTDAVVAEMADLSYRTVVGKLPKYIQKKLNHSEAQLSWSERTVHIREVGGSIPSVSTISELVLYDLL